MPPNSVNNFFGIKVSKAGIPVQNASDKQLIYKDDFSTKTFYDQTNSRMIEGLLPDGTYGLWVSEPGVDVTTATDDQLIFSSSRNIFKIVDTLDMSATRSSNGTTTTTVAHGLSYIPAYIAFIQADATFASFFGGLSNNGPNPNLVYALDNLNGEVIVLAIAMVSTDSTNVYLRLSIPGSISSSYTWTAKVYLLQQTAFDS